MQEYVCTDCGKPVREHLPNQLYSCEQCGIEFYPIHNTAEDKYYLRAFNRNAQKRNEIKLTLPAISTSRYEWVEMVAEFHRRFEHPINEKPSPFVEYKIEKLREDLLREEMQELTDAMRHQNLTQIADGICDMLYVLIGTAHTYGLGFILDKLFAEVHASNMSKLGEDGKPIYREDGKTLKGPNYFKPKLATIITEAL